MIKNFLKAIEGDFVSCVLCSTLYGLFANAILISYPFELRFAVVVFIGITFGFWWPDDSSS